MRMKSGSSRVFIGVIRVDPRPEVDRFFCRRQSRSRVPEFHFRFIPDTDAFDAAVKGSGSGLRG
jgi:hypothetical protein